MTTEGADVKHENDFDEEYFQFVSMSETNARLLLHEEYFQFVSMSKTNARLLYMYKFDTFPLSGHERRFSWMCGDQWHIVSILYTVTHDLQIHEYPLLNKHSGC